jgi:CxxC motif-containing protein
MENKIRELICIGCPLGCQLLVELAAEPGLNEDCIRSVSGYECPRGEAYARNEVLRPLRMVTALVAVAGRTQPLSVRTRSPIPKSLIFDCLRAIRALTLTAPIHQGDCILADVLGTGVDVIATRDLL